MGRDDAARFVAASRDMEACLESFVLGVSDSNVHRDGVWIGDDRFYGPDLHNAVAWVRLHLASWRDMLWVADDELSGLGAASDIAEFSALGLPDIPAHTDWIGCRHSARPYRRRKVAANAHCVAFAVLDDLDGHFLGNETRRNTESAGDVVSLVNGLLERIESDWESITWDDAEYERLIARLERERSKIVPLLPKGDRAGDNACSTPTPQQVDAIRRVLARKQTDATVRTIKSELEKDAVPISGANLQAALDQLRTSGEYTGPTKRRKK